MVWIVGLVMKPLSYSTAESTGIQDNLQACLPSGRNAHFRLPGGQAVATPRLLDKQQPPASNIPDGEAGFELSGLRHRRKIPNSFLNLDLRPSLWLPVRRQPNAKRASPPQPSRQQDEAKRGDFDVLSGKLYFTLPSTIHCTRMELCLLLLPSCGIASNQSPSSWGS